VKGQNIKIQTKIAAGQQAHNFIKFSDAIIMAVRRHAHDLPLVENGLNPR